MNTCQGCFLKGSSLSKYVCESCKYDYFRTPQGQNAMACIKELEKIKAEIKAERDKLKMKNFNVITGMEVGIDIIDKHIAELKGEYNE